MNVGCTVEYRSPLSPSVAGIIRSDWLQIVVKSERRRSRGRISVAKNHVESASRPQGKRERCVSREQVTSNSPRRKPHSQHQPQSHVIIIKPTEKHSRSPSVRKKADGHSSRNKEQAPQAKCQSLPRSESRSTSRSRSRTDTHRDKSVTHYDSLLE